MSEYFYVVDASNEEHLAQRGECFIIQFSRATFPRGNANYHLAPISPEKQQMRETYDCLKELPTTNLGVRDFNERQGADNKINTLCIHPTGVKKFTGDICVFLAEVCNKEDSGPDGFRHMHYSPEYPYPKDTQLIVLIFPNGWGILKIIQPTK